MTTLDDVIRIHKETCDKARSIVEKKGRDYNRGMQDKDTLFNISVGYTLGIVDSIPQGILVRLSDKLMRLISLTKNPMENPDIVSESVNDTIEDSINYLIYLKIKYNEARGKNLYYFTCPKCNNLSDVLCNDLCTKCYYIGERNEDSIK